MDKKILYIIILNLSLFCGCNSNINNKPIEDTVCMSYTVSNMSQLAYEVLMYGDTNSYESLSMAYLDLGKFNFYPYAYIMANKYNYSYAYFEVFEIMTIDLTMFGESNIDSLTASLAIWHLLEAAKRGNKAAIERVERYSISEDDIADAKYVLSDMFD